MPNTGRVSAGQFRMEDMPKANVVADTRRLVQVVNYHETDVLKSHRSVRVNEKTHDFWAVKKFIHRLACVYEEYGISLEAESEAGTSQTCPECDDHEETVRPQGYADVSVWLRGTQEKATRRTAIGTWQPREPGTEDWGALRRDTVEAATTAKHCSDNR